MHRATPVTECASIGAVVCRVECLAELGASPTVLRHPLMDARIERATSTADTLQRRVSLSGGAAWFAIGRRARLAD